jgi:peroxiredoxin
MEQLMPSQKLAGGSSMPKISVPKAGGGELIVGNSKGWELLVVYRGKHCPICKSYLGTLDKLLDQFKAIGTEVFAVSADTREKAEAEATEQAWRFPVGYGLSQVQMRALGLYISEPRSLQETDRPFPEPGLFVVNPEGQVQIVDISNAPFARPDLNAVLNGIKFVREKGYPIRGTLA